MIERENILFFDTYDQCEGCRDSDSPRNAFHTVR